MVFQSEVCLNEMRHYCGGIVSQGSELAGSLLGLLPIDLVVASLLLEKEAVVPELLQVVRSGVRYD